MAGASAAYEELPEELPDDADCSELLLEPPAEPDWPELPALSTLPEPFPSALSVRVWLSRVKVAVQLLSATMLTSPNSLSHSRASRPLQPSK